MVSRISCREWGWLRVEKKNVRVLNHRVHTGIHQVRKILLKNEAGEFVSAAVVSPGHQSSLYNPWIHSLRNHGSDNWISFVVRGADFSCLESCGPERSN